MHRASGEDDGPRFSDDLLEVLGRVQKDELEAGFPDLA